MSLGPWMSLSLHRVSTFLHMKCSPLLQKLQQHLAESVSSYDWERRRWDGFVTSPIKHVQLNISALNVCHRGSSLDVTDSY